jgi:hypothetical protein
LQTVGNWKSKKSKNRLPLLGKGNTVYWPKVISCVRYIGQKWTGWSGILAKGVSLGEGECCILARSGQGEVEYWPKVLAWVNTDRKGMANFVIYSTCCDLGSTAYITENSVLYYFEPKSQHVSYTEFVVPFLSVKGYTALVVWWCYSLGERVYCILARSGHGEGVYCIYRQRCAAKRRVYINLSPAYGSPATGLESLTKWNDFLRLRSMINEREGVSYFVCLARVHHKNHRQASLRPGAWQGCKGVWHLE